MLIKTCWRNQPALVPGSLPDLTPVSCRSSTDRCGPLTEGIPANPDPHITARLILTHVTPALPSAQSQHPHTGIFVCVRLMPQGQWSVQGCPGPPAPSAGPTALPTLPPPTNSKLPSFAPPKFHPAPEISNATLVFHDVFLKKNPTCISVETPSIFLRWQQCWSPDGLGASGAVRAQTETLL